MISPLYVSPNRKRELARLITSHGGFHQANRLRGTASAAQRATRRQAAGLGTKAKDATRGPITDANGSTEHVRIRPMNASIEFLSAITNAFEANKQLADRAVQQLPDEKLHVALDENTNSIAVIMKHVAGNLNSRWSDFLSTDGEKPWRNRDAEFVDTFGSRAEILEIWERGWACLLMALRSLRPADLEKTVLIRGEPHSVPLAIARSLGHTCYHIGQIVQVARFHAGQNWNTLTIPKGGSQQFNQAHWGQTGKSHS